MSQEPKWFSFLIPKTCDDYLTAKKSDMFVNALELREKMNIVAMNLLNDTVYAFNCDGNFIEFKLDLSSKNLHFEKKRFISEFKMDYNEQ